MFPCDGYKSTIRFLILKKNHWNSTLDAYYLNIFVVGLKWLVSG